MVTLVDFLALLRGGEIFAAPQEFPPIMISAHRHPGRSRCVLGSLRREHALVRRALTVLDRQAAHVDIGGDLPTRDLGWLLGFFREFFLAVHSCKEVRHLCPAIALHGSDRDAELTGSLLREHDDTRELLHSLELFNAPTAGLAEEERQGFVDAARTCARRMSRLMRDEETSLFPIAVSCLPCDEQLTLLEAFADLDRHHRSATSWEKELRDLEATWVN